MAASALHAAGCVELGEEADYHAPSLPSAAQDDKHLLGESCLKCDLIPDVIDRSVQNMISCCTMSRPREFDMDKALDRVMRVFWERGYHATSVQDLMKAAGVQKQSLYCAFGDKRSLFLKCLNLYIKQTLLATQKMLNDSDSPLDGIARVMRFVSQAPDSKNCPPGCLMANTALELGLDDPDVADEIRRMFRSMEKMLGAALRKAQTQGEISKKLDCIAVGQSLVNTVSGIRILEKTGASRQQVRTVVETALAAIQR
jgi:TetR/AcrR family transcriptional regulator, transcriptional repressor for nem operon